MHIAPPKSQLVGSRAVLAYALIGAVFAGGFLSLGMGGALIDRIIAAIFIVLNSAWIPIVYLIGSLGLGRIARKWAADLPTRWIIELCVGFTLMLTLSHGLGVLGMLNPISAWVVIGVGVLIVLIDGRAYFDQLNGAIGRTTLSIPGIAFLLGCVVVVLMSCNPPGVSWDSEFGSYDALSYHLQLPREWLELGRITPIEHNVYSYLPSYFESAYLHFAYLANAPSTTASGLSGFLANDARVLMSTQLFSAILVLVSGCAIGSVVRRAIVLFVPDSSGDQPALLARMLMVCTPWIVVVGSLAYNEMGVVLLGIGAFAIAIERESSASARAMICALIVAGACSCKPTALFLLAPSVGVVLLATIPVRQWIKPVIFGSIVGVLTLAPWLIRNELATGNIVFPQGSSLFGDGHWSADQHTLYRGAHQFEGSLIDRFTMLFLPDSTGKHHVSRFRGFTNIQWGITAMLGFIGFILMIAQPRTRILGATTGLALLLPMLSWMVLTHLQSRFLVPLTPILIGAGALGLATVRHETIASTLTNALSMIACCGLLFIGAIQSNANPFMLVDLGTGVFTGEIEIADSPWTATLNSILDPHETVYLLGDATPMYVRSPMVYNTVYDHWLIEDAINAHPTEPSKWTGTLQRQGIDVVVVSFSEINRFANSQWLPQAITPDGLNEWIQTLGEPIYVWTQPDNPNPVRAAFRLAQ